MEWPITASGSHAVGAPQRGQRQLHAHQHRLDPVDPHHRLARGQHLGAAKNRPGRRNRAPARRPPRRTPAPRPATADPSPPTANPDPSTRTPCPDPRGTSRAATTPGAGSPAANARRPATASARSRAHTAATRLRPAAVMVDRVRRRRPTAHQHPAPSIHSANRAADERDPLGTACPDTTNVVTDGDPADPATTTGSGPCSTTTCAFVPPRPNDDTAARRGPLLARPVRRSVGTNSRVGAASIVRVPLLEVAGSAGSRRAAGDSTVLMKPATPAAASRWPMLVLTAPSAHATVAAAVHRGQRVELDRVAQDRCRCRGSR